MGKEAAERSAARVGAYDVLQRVLLKHGLPFKDGDKLPREYQDLFPRHHLSNKGRLRIENSEANLLDSHHNKGWLDTEGSESMISEEDGRSASRGTHKHGSKPHTSEDEVENGLFDVYEGDCEGNDNWDLDPEEGNSDVDVQG